MRTITIADWRDQLPTVSKKNVAVRVRKSAEKHLRTHPWLFDRAITSLSHPAKAGDVAVVFDDKRRFLAAGFFDPDSPIRIKLLQHGKPARLNHTFVHAKIAASVAVRAPLVNTNTTGFRLVNGENDGLPALIADRYADSVVLKLYSPIWFPHLGNVAEWFAEQAWCERIVLRLSRRVQSAETFGLHDGMTLFGAPPIAPVLFRENGLIFEADIVRGQKTGHFLDQRDNRQRVRDLANKKRVLDMFASTGGFTVYAAAGGATSITSVDLSAPTLAVAKRNLAHNGLQVADCKVQVGDAFDVLKQLRREGKRFDVVIIDPPSFAQKQADVDGAIAAYKRLTRLGMAVLQTGGVLVQASCSSRVSTEAFFKAVQGVGKGLHEIERTTHAVDHPIAFPEGGYLKCFFGRKT